MEVIAGLAESSGRLLLGIWRDSLHVACGLTACTLGSAPGPTLGNEFGKTLPLPSHVQLCRCHTRFVSHYFYSQRSNDVIRRSGFAIPSFDEPLSMQSMRDLRDFS